MPARSRRRLAVLVAVLVALLLVWVAQRVAKPARSRSTPRAQVERVRPPPSAPYVAPADAVDETAEEAPRPFRAEPWRLANGMTAIVVRDPSAPTIAARIVVRAGGADDPPGLAGLAHLVEHLMFAGTSRLGTEDFAREAVHLDELRALTSELAETTDPAAREEIEAAIVAAHEAADAYGLPNEVHRLLDELGATGANAWTGVEHTVYGAVLPASAFEPWAVLEAERFTDPVFRSFVNERRVVEEELAVRSDHAGRRTPEDQRAALFGDHPLAAPVGGTPESLARASLADAEAFFDRWYVPGNMAVVLVGAIDLTTARRVLDDTLGRIPPGPVPKPTRPPVREHRGLVRIEGEGQAEAAFLVRDFVPGDLEALKVASGALGDELFERGRGRVWGAKVGIERFTDAAIVRISGRCEKRDRDACLARIRDAVRTVGRGGSWREELASARIWAWIDRLEELERQDVQADQLARGWARGESPAELWASLVRLHDLDVGRISETVRRLLSPDDLVYVGGDGTMVAETPGRSVAAPTEVDDPRSSALYEEILAIPQPEQPSGWRIEGRDFTRTDRVVAVVNPSNPLFRAQLRWPIGTRDDPHVCRALLRWMLPDSDGWTTRLHRRGVRVEDRFKPDCGWDSASVWIRGPGSEAAESLRLVLDALRAPRLGERHPFGHLFDVFSGPASAGARAVYGDAVPSPEPDGGEPPTAVLAASLRRLGATAPDVRYVGPHTAVEVAAMVPGGARTEAPPLLAVRARGVQVWPAVKEKTAAAIRVGEPYDPDREPLYALYEHWMAGPAGVAREEVRTALGDAYSISARYARGARPGLPNVTEVRVTAKTGDPVETARVLAAVFDVPRVDGARWDRIREATEVHAWSDVTPFRAAAGPLADAFARGLDGDPAEVIWAGLGDVTRADFDAFLADEALSPLVLVVTGADADDARLRDIGPVERMP